MATVKFEMEIEKDEIPEAFERIASMVRELGYPRHEVLVEHGLSVVFDVEGPLTRVDSRASVGDYVDVRGFTYRVFSRDVTGRLILDLPSD